MSCHLTAYVVFTNSNITTALLQIEMQKENIKNDHNYCLYIVFVYEQQRDCLCLYILINWSVFAIVYIVDILVLWGNSDLT